MSFQFSQMGEPEPSNQQAEASTFHLQVCPHLGLYDDPALVLTEPSDSHRCFARSRPSLPGFEHQETYCLRGEHVRCPYFTASAKVSDVAPAPSPFNEPFRGFEESDRVGQRRRWPALLAALIGAIVLGATALFAGDYVNNLQVPTAISELLRRIEQATPETTPLANAVAQVNTETAPTIEPTATALAEATTTPTEAIATTTAIVNSAVAAIISESTTLSETAILITQTSVPTTTTIEAVLGEPVEYATPTPPPGGSTITLAPRLGNVGWWQTNDGTHNHLNDSFLYAGVNNGESFISAARFELADIPRGSEIVNAELRLTGLRADRFTDTVKSTWIVQLIAESELRNLVRTDFLGLYGAPASIILFPQLSERDLAAQKVNSWQFDESARRWLEQQVFNGAATVLIRIQATTEKQADSLFAWDSGLGPESSGNAPALVISLGQPPATPPPTVVQAVIVATLTPTPENVLTEVALAATATEIATLIGTYTPPPFDVVTPTPLPRNVETAQAIALELNELPVVIDTATPANEETAAAYANIATAVARTTGTYTPVPFPYSTPVLVLPSPPAENVATLAARVATSTAEASVVISETATPLPYNAVLADYVYATEVPLNRATAQAQIILATAEAQTTGTPTSLPWNAVIITRVPTPRVRGAGSGDASTPSSDATPAATVIPPIDIAELRGKIVHRRSGEKGDEVWVYDPASGVSTQVGNPQVMAEVESRLGVSPDGRVAVAERDGSGQFQIAIRGTDGSMTFVTALSGANYDATWSPKGDLIAFVSNQTGDEEIYVVSPDGTNLRQLTTSARFDKHPSWSPDGSKIVFYSTRTGKPELWIMNADGGDQRMLTSTGATEFDPVWVR